MARRLREWDDEREKERGVDEYYADRSAWMRKRSAYRERERRQDEADRAAERRERDTDSRQRDRARGEADAFLGGMERDREVEERRREEEARKQQPARFKLSLGAAAAQKQASDKEKNKRTVAEVEGLLEDEEVDAAKRELVKIDFGKPEGMSEEERAQAAKQLAQEIPTDKGGLWGWEVKWEFVDEGIIEERLKPFVEKKIVEYLGVQEQMLVDVVVGGLRSRKGAEEIVGELEGALDEEAEQLVKKLWRMVIFFSESEKRGLGSA